MTDLSLGGVAGASNNIGAGAGDDDAPVRQVPTSIYTNTTEKKDWSTIMGEVKLNECEKPFLDLTGRQCGPSGMRELAKQLAFNDQLQELYLSGCDLGDEGVEILCDQVLRAKKRPPINKVDLFDNNITCKGMEFLKAALIENPDITDLFLWNNQIGNFGAGHLAQALKSNQTLIRLQMSGNVVGCMGAKDLADALSYNQTLTELGLHSNSIGESGAKAFAEMIQTQETLKILNLGNNCFGLKARPFFTAAMTVNKAVTNLYIAWNFKFERATKKKKKGKKKK